MFVKLKYAYMMKVVYVKHKIEERCSKHEVCLCVIFETHLFVYGRFKLIEKKMQNNNVLLVLNGPTTRYVCSSCTCDTICS